MCVCPSVSVYLSVCLSVFVSVTTFYSHQCVHVRLSVCHCMSLSVCPSVRLYVCLPVHTEHIQEPCDQSPRLWTLRVASSWVPWLNWETMIEIWIRGKMSASCSFSPSWLNLGNRQPRLLFRTFQRPYWQKEKGETSEKIKTVCIHMIPLYPLCLYTPILE
jgi:hypothetical protein